MKELVGDKFYTTLSEKYNELLLDYVCSVGMRTITGQNLTKKL